jgi:hypothetical protein
MLSLHQKNFSENMSLSFGTISSLETLRLSINLLDVTITTSLRMWVYSRLGYQKKGKGTPSLSYGYFYKYHFHETNLVDEN